MHLTFRHKHYLALTYGIILLSVTTGLQEQGQTILKAHLNHQAAAGTAFKEAPGIVGLNLSIRPSTYPTVLLVYPGTPAEKNGLRTGDQILTINTQDTRDMSRAQVDQAISDIPGDKVEFIINRQGHLLHSTLIVESLEQLQSKSLQNLYQELLPHP